MSSPSPQFPSRDPSYSATVRIQHPSLITADLTSLAEIKHAYADHRVDRVAVVEKLLRIAIDQGRPSVIVSIARVDPNLLNLRTTEGDPRPIVRAFTAHKFYPEVVAMLLYQGVSWNSRYTGGTSPLGALVLKGNVEEAFGRLIAVNKQFCGGAPVTGLPKLLSLSSAQLTQIRVLDRARAICRGQSQGRWSVGGPFDQVVRGLIDIQAPLRNIEQAIDFCAAWNQIDSTRLINDPKANPAPFLRLVQASFGSGVKRVVRPLVKYADQELYNPKPRASHPIQAELMVLFNHRDVQRNPKLMKEVNEALTAITGFKIKQIDDLSEFMVLGTFARIGAHNHHFSRSKWDTKRYVGRDKSMPPVTLFERFGFERAPVRQTDRPCQQNPREGFGPGFIYDGRVKGGLRIPVTQPGSELPKILTFSPTSFVEMRRSYELICTEYCTLALRNSSPEFGRYAFSVPALWSPHGRNYYSDEQLLNFPSLIDDFHSVLDPTIHTGAMGHRFETSVSAALDELDALQIAYGRSKFDTCWHSAWDRSIEGEETQPLGMHFSPLFPDCVDMLLAAHESGAVVPDLAFASQRGLPWGTYGFRPGGVGKLRTRLAVTSQVLKALQGLVTTELDPHLMQESGLQDFMQQAGVEKEGSLIFVDPLSGSEII